MDMRDEWRERKEDRREKEDSRDGMGVGTFSLIWLVFREGGVFVPDLMGTGVLLSPFFLGVV